MRCPGVQIRHTLRLAGVRFIGVESQYFVALFAPGEGGAGELRQGSLPSEDGKAQPAAVAAVELHGTPVELFVGAKDYDALKALGHDFASVVNVGEWISPIVVPLLSFLRWVHGLVGNYGWSIVLLTVMINLIMAPLRH